MLYTVWKVALLSGTSIEVTRPDSQPNAIAAARTLNAHAPQNTWYTVCPLGGTPSDLCYCTGGANAHPHHD